MDKTKTRVVRLKRKKRNFSPNAKGYSPRKTASPWDIINTRKKPSSHRRAKSFRVQSKRHQHRLRLSQTVVYSHKRSRSRSTSARRYKTARRAHSAKGPVSRKEVDLQEGDRIVVKKQKGKGAGERIRGTVRYVGNVEWAQGIWVGVELDNAVGTNDGTIGERTYFECHSRCGLFVKPANVVLQLLPCPICSERFDFDVMEAHVKECLEAL